MAQIFSSEIVRLCKRILFERQLRQTIDELSRYTEMLESALDTADQIKVIEEYMQLVRSLAKNIADYTADIRDTRSDYVKNFDRIMDPMRQCLIEQGAI